MNLTSKPSSLQKNWTRSRRSHSNPNFRVLGPKYGKGVQAIAKVLAGADAVALKAEVEANGSLQIEAAGETYTLDPSEIDVQTQNREGFFVEVDARKFVALSTELTHELVLEGLARELGQQDPKYAERSRF